MKSFMRDLPEIKELKKLEQISKKEGSGVVYEELLGIWKFQYLCKKGSDEIDNISSFILKVLSAKLELNKRNSEGNMNYEIRNSIDFGLLNITFIGRAKLQGSRPNLPFYFENLKVNIGNLQILSMSFQKPEDKKMPFFSLVGISKEDNWMCARGRGGGLAIWVKS